MRWKLLIFLVATAVVFFSLEHVWLVWVQPEVMTRLALRQMERCTQPTRWIRTIGQLQNWFELAGILASLGAAAVLGFGCRLRFKKDRASVNPTDTAGKERKVMKRTGWSAMVLVALLVAGGG